MNNTNNLVVPTPRKSKKIPRWALITLFGGLLAVVSNIISLIVIFGVYGCASDNFNKVSCANLNKDQTIVNVCVYIGYAGIAIVVVGLSLLVIKEIKKEKKLK